MGSFRRRLLAGPAALFAACAVVGLASSASASSSSANFFAGRDGKTSFPLLNPRGIPELEPQLSDDFDVNPDYHDAEVEYFALKKRHAEEDCAGTNKDGRKMCGPLCGTCPEGECCRGIDMTCGQGSAFCNNKCTPQFSLGTCPVQNVTHNKLYKWWETDGPGGSRNGRLFSPDDFPTNAAGKALAARMNSTLHARQLVPNGIKPIGAACVVTAADGWGGCASSCCLKGICQACDKCAPNPLKDSSRCKWCMRNNRTISNEGCLLRGDKCTTNGLAPGNPISRCRSGCCKLGVCTWCENCAMGCKCAANGTQELNPGGRCVTKTSSTTRTRTTSKSRTRTRTTTRLPPPIYDGNGKGKGMVITGCPGGRRVAITFDDGPFLYTQQLLDTLDNLGAKVTFFVNGKNYGNIDDRKYLIERMKNSGHCIGSHGWLHKSMPELGGYAAQLNNLVQLDQALWEILRGIRPRYFRPPFGNYNQDTINAARHVGYDVVMWNLDANDWELRNPDLEMNNYYAAFTGKNPDQTAFISLQHDVYAETVQNLATRAINYVRGLGYQVVDMGTCMGGGVWDCYQQ